MSGTLPLWPYDKLDLLKPKKALNKRHFAIRAISNLKLYVQLLGTLAKVTYVVIF